MINPETLAREKLLFTYSTALEAGDFARLEQILAQAAEDATLEQQIVALHAAMIPSPQDASSQAPEPGFWQRLSNRWSVLVKSPDWIPGLVRTGAVVLTLLFVVLFGVQALLGPAIGNIFSNIVQYGPPGPDGRQSYQYSTPSPTRLASSSYNYPQYSATPTPVQIPYQGNAQYVDPYNAYPAPLAPVAQPGERMIARDGSLSLETEDTRAARSAVMAMMTEYAAEGAFVVSSNEGYRSGEKMPVISMQLRVPVKRYDASMNRLVALGSQVLNRQETAQDVTDAYVDVSGRIAALEASRERLVQIIKEAKNTDDLLRAEQELSRRESELEAAKGTQQYLAQTSALASIALQLNPPQPIAPVVDSRWNPATSLRNALRVLLSDLRGLADGLIYFVIAVLPWLLLIALLVYAGMRVYRFMQRRP